MDEDEVKKLTPSKKRRGGFIGGKELPKPLVVVGPLCSGKSVLIDYLKYNRGHHFVHVLPYTSRRDFLKDEAEGADYLKSPDGNKFFMQEERPGEVPIWFFKYKTDTAAKTKFSMTSSGMYSMMDKPFHMTGVLLHDVKET